MNESMSIRHTLILIKVRTMQKERIIFLDYVRAAACLMVMLVHASENYYLCAPEGAPSGEMVNVVSKITSWDAQFWVSVIDGFCRMSVPLFMITSAYLLCPIDENTSWKSFFRRRALRIVPPMLVFLVLYSVLPLLWGGTTLEQAIDNVLYIPFNFPGAAGHMWFLYPLLSLYLFIPILSPWLRQSTAKQELMFIGLFVLSTTIPFFNRMGMEVFGQVWWNPFHALYPFAGYLGYLVLAHYIRFHIHWSSARRLVVGIPCVIVGALITILSFYLQIDLGVEQEPTHVEIAWCFCTPNVILLTFGFFLILTTINRPLPGYAWVRDISLMSYGMYLMHMFYLVLFSGIFIPVLPVYFSIPAIALCTYICCYLTTKLISYIPGSKWIIG